MGACGDGLADCGFMHQRLSKPWGAAKGLNAKMRTTACRDASEAASSSRSPPFSDVLPMPKITAAILTLSVTVAGQSPLPGGETKRLS